MEIVSNIITVTEGDTLPALICTYKDDDGVVASMAGITATLHIGYNTPLVKVATTVDEVNGLFAFLWDEGDLVAGDEAWQAEIQFSSVAGILTAQKLADGKKFKIRINPQVA